MSGIFARAMIGNAVSFYHVNQAHSTEASNGAEATNVDNSDATVTIWPTLYNDWVVCAISTNNLTITPGPGQTQRQNVSSALGPGTGAMTRELIKRGIAPERMVAIEWDANFARTIAAEFPGVGHAESARNGGHVPAARGPARSVLLQAAG